jgi:ribonuclease R
VHRALISAHGWGNDGLKPDEIERLEETAKHISDTERRSMAAERDTTDRYLAAFLSDRVGATFTGRISGIAALRRLREARRDRADGLLPMRALGHEYFHHDADSQTLMGAESGLVIGIGDRVEVRLAEAVPVTGGLTLELVGFDGKEMPKRAGRGRRRFTKAQGGQVGEEARQAGRRPRGAAERSRRSAAIPHNGM